MLALNHIVILFVSVMCSTEPLNNSEKFVPKTEFEINFNEQKRNKSKVISGFSLNLFLT
jgi:hypothetical protein